MQRLSWRGLVAICILAILASGGCSSTSLDSWADRAVASVSLLEVTTNGMYEAQFKAEALNQSNSVAAAYREIKNRFLLHNPATQPANDPTPEVWLAGSELFLNTRLSASRAKEVELRARQEVTKGGFNDVREDLGHIKDINASWWRTDASTAASIQALANQINMLTQKVNTK